MKVQLLEVNSVKDEIAKMHANVTCSEVEHGSFFFFAVITKIQILVEHSVCRPGMYFRWLDTHIINNRVFLSVELEAKVPKVK